MAAVFIFSSLSSEEEARESILNTHPHSNYNTFKSDFTSSSFSNIHQSIHFIKKLLKSSLYFKNRTLEHIGSKKSVEIYAWQKERQNKLRNVFSSFQSVFRIDLYFTEWNQVLIFIFYMYLCMVCFRYHTEFPVYKAHVLDKK